jgi:hypothetical protein
VIRTVALGVVCLAGLGAIAAAARKPTLLQQAEIVFPIVAGSKADRLPLMPRLDSPADVERVDVAYVPPVEAPSELPVPQKVASPPLPRIASRHWHDHRKFSEATKRRASASRSPTKDSVDRATKQASATKECRSDGLDPLLRKLNLSPQCE